MRRQPWTLSIPNLTQMFLLLSLNYLKYRMTSRKLIQLQKQLFIKKILIAPKFRERYREKYSICVTFLCKVNSSIHLQTMTSLILRVNQQHQMNSCRRHMRHIKILNKYRSFRLIMMISLCKNKRREKSAFLLNQNRVSPAFKLKLEITKCPELIRRGNSQITLKRIRLQTVTSMILKMLTVI